MQAAVGSLPMVLKQHLTLFIMAIKQIINNISLSPCCYIVY